MKGKIHRGGMPRAISALGAAAVGIPTRGGGLESRKASLLIFVFRVLKDSQQSFVYSTGRSKPLEGTQKSSRNSRIEA